LIIKYGINMSNSKKLVEAFSVALGINSDIVVDDLEYASINEWDSVAHMSLIAELEETFDIMLDTDQIIDMSTVAKAKEILATHNVEF
jgi:acyl carrier protein